MGKWESLQVAVYFWVTTATALVGAAGTAGAFIVWEFS
jgi:hypothetical protein